MNLCREIFLFHKISHYSIFMQFLIKSTLHTFLYIYKKNYLCAKITQYGV